VVLPDVLARPTPGLGPCIPVPRPPIATRQGRRLTGMVFGEWDLGALKEAVLRVMSEMGVLAHIEVTDAGPGSPKVRNVGETDLGGRGLLLVQPSPTNGGIDTMMTGRRPFGRRSPNDSGERG
jgi:hypothetical protein